MKNERQNTRERKEGKSLYKKKNLYIYTKCHGTRLTDMHQKKEKEKENRSTKNVPRLVYQSYSR